MIVSVASVARFGSNMRATRPPKRIPMTAVAFGRGERQVRRETTARQYGKVGGSTLQALSAYVRKAFPAMKTVAYEE